MVFTYLIILLISIIVGFINTLAGSGSLIMLPLLMSLGLPSNVANGTNRVAVLFQSAVGVSVFMKNKTVVLGNAWWSIVPCVLGALVGAVFATQIAPASLKKIIGVLLILMLLVILIQPKRWLRNGNSDGSNSRKIGSILIMFFIGIYGGFIQAGIGIFLLIGLVLGVKYNIGHANAIKLIIVLAYACPVLLIFAWKGQVDWFLGFFTAIGQSVGAFIGARFATRHKNADVWIYRLLIIVVLGAVVHFYKLWIYLY